MATASGSEHGHMDIASQKAMFGGFLKVVEWACVLIAMLLGLLVFSFAIGFGWWIGVMAWAAIGVVAGLVMRMKSAWWITLVVTTVVLVLGGAISMGVASLF